MFFKKCKSKKPEEENGNYLDPFPRESHCKHFVICPFHSIMYILLHMCTIFPQITSCCFSGFVTGFFPTTIYYE